MILFLFSETTVAFLLPSEHNVKLIHCLFKVLYHLFPNNASSFYTTFSQFSRSVMSNSLRPHGLQHTRPPCLSPTRGVNSNSRPLSQWCHTTISPSVIPFSSHLQSFPKLGSFYVNQSFISGDQSTGVSASASVLLMNTQYWFPLGLTGLISLKSKELLRVFPNTIVQKLQFFGTQPPLWSNSHIHTWLLTKP